MNRPLADDPTYNRTEIQKNEVWNYAFYLSEMENDNAPIGWGAYIPRAMVELDRIAADVKAGGDGTGNGSRS